MFTSKKLQSGREVYIRPLSWNEFWEFGIQRTESIHENASASEILQASRNARERALCACVQHWSNLCNELSLPEVLEIEKLIDDISKAPILEGNSSPVAATTATVKG